MIDMAKSKKTAEKQDNQRHKFPTLGLRFPDRLMAALRELAAKNRRTLTAEVEIAIENHLATAGFWPPKE